MPNNISAKLSNWISQAESVQTFTDFKLPVEAAAKYTIIPKYEDFFIQLYCLAVDLLSTDVNDPLKILSISKGLDVFCKSNQLSEFSGVDKATSQTLSAALKFIAGRYSTAFLMVKTINFIEINDTAEAQLTLSILKRSFPKNGFEYQKNLTSFFQTGNIAYLDELEDILKNKIEDFNLLDPLSFFETLVAQKLLAHFKNNNICSTLLEIKNDYSFWALYLQENFSAQIWMFFPSQQEAIKKQLLSAEHSVSLQMPTSAGKTALCELIIYYYSKSNPDKKIALLAPFRALASELRATLGKKIQQYGITVKALYGGSRPNTEDITSAETANVLIATPEKLMAVEDITPSLFDNLELVLCDEGHLLDDDSRGLDYELFLTRLRVQKVNQIKFIYLSAIVPNISTINTWLGGETDSVVFSDYRPTEISLAAITQSARGRNYNLLINRHLGAENLYRLYNFIRKADYQYINEATGRKKSYPFYSTKNDKSAASALKAMEGGVVALFATTKNKNGISGLCEKIIKQLSAAKELGFNINSPLDYSNPEQQVHLVEYFSTLFSSEYLLVKCLQHGFTLHHGTLPQFAREIIENALRNEDIRLVVCTNTLAEGVNLPIRSLVIHSTKRYFNEKWHTLRIRDLKNLIGRVGRAGKEANGFIFVPHDVDLPLIEKAITDSDLEPVKGSLFNIVKVISEVVNTNNLELTNDILEAQEEKFLRIVDSLDSTIIELTTEETPLENIETVLTTLIEKTFSYTQSDDAEKETLTKLFSLRSTKIKENYTLDQILAMKKTGATQRLYNQAEQNIDFDSDRWEACTSPICNDWLAFIFNSVCAVSTFEQDLAEKEISTECFLSVLQEWMNGNTYGAISNSNNLSIDETIELIEHTIGYDFTNIASKLIRLKEDRLPEDIDLPEAISDWVYYAQNGINTEKQKLLHQLGFSERLSLKDLANILDASFPDATERSNLISVLRNNKTHLLPAMLDSNLPTIAKQEVKSSYEKLDTLW